MAAKMDPRLQSYLPALEVRPAELLALQELPAKDKDAMLPLFRLRPWTSANKLSSALERIQLAFGKRPHYLEMSGPEPVLPGKEREVHAELSRLRDPAEGFRNWCDFFEVAGREHVIPVAQLSDPFQYVSQIQQLYKLGRGILVRLDVSVESIVNTIVQITADITDGGRGILFVLDFGKRNQKFLDQTSDVASLLLAAKALAPRGEIAMSASSFPDGFTLITEQAIYERKVFEAIKSKVPGLIYSDRGSARAERQVGGGGAPAPRVDFARPNDWVFFRDSTGGDRLAAYQRQAVSLMESESWDPRLKLWGCQMIEKTALADETGITSPNRSTAARINIHLHQQLYYGLGEALYDTDEDWVDF